MEALVKQKVGRIALTGRKMFDVDIEITSDEIGSLSLHTNWRDMPYPMYKNKIKKLQKLVDNMTILNWSFKLMSQFFDMYYYQNMNLDNTMIELAKYWTIDECRLLVSLVSVLNPEHKKIEL